MTVLCRCLWFLCSKWDDAICHRKPPGVTGRMNNRGVRLFANVVSQQLQLSPVSSAIPCLLVLKTCELSLCSNKELQYLDWSQTSDRLNLQGELRREIMAYPTTDHLEKSLLLPSRHRSASALVHEGKIKPTFMVPRNIILNSTGTNILSILVTV